MMRSKTFIRSLLILTLLSTVTLAFSQKKLLESGPMLGYVNLREAMIWLQTAEPATTQITYWAENTPKQRLKTRKLKTRNSKGCTAKYEITALEPGTIYQYEVTVNGKKVNLPYPTRFTTQQHWQYRTDPPKFSVATGSCNYVNEAAYDRPGTPYGSEHQIFRSIAAKKPDAMLWLGDNTYLREGDFGSKTGMIHRYTHTRSLPEMQELLAIAANYATWDDHDFGPNDSDGTWVRKQDALDVFKMFWGNPTYGVEGAPGVATAFTINDVDFFVADNRYYRTPDVCKTCPDKSQLGATQRQWLLESLASSTAPFKIVSIGGQFLTTNDHHETYQHYFQAEHDSILAFIDRENIKNVIFITGDRHFTELSKYTNSSGNVLYDITTSSLTAGVYKGAAKEQNAYRVEGTLLDEHNFAVLEFSGPRKERVLEIKVYKTDGTEAWTQRISSQK